MASTAPVRAARMQCRQLVEGGVSKKQSSVRRCLMDAFDCVAQTPDIQPSAFDFLNATTALRSKPSWFVLTPQRSLARSPLGCHKPQAKSPAERALSFGFR